MFDNINKRKHTVSYNRFVERQAQVGMHLLLFLETCALGKCTMGWFYGFKLHLVTRLKRNMKNSLMILHDKLMLRKRSVIETVNEELKNVRQIEHTRHRSVDNFVTNLLAGLIAFHHPYVSLPSDFDCRKEMEQE